MPEAIRGDEANPHWGTLAPESAAMLRENVERLQQANAQDLVVHHSLVVEEPKLLEGLGLLLS